MSDKSLRTTPTDFGFVRELILQIKLSYRLMTDKRVNPFLKILPIASVIYLFVPFDLAPIFPVDDVAIVSLGFYSFIEFCPKNVVEEHLRDLRGVSQSTAMEVTPTEDVIDAEFQELDGQEMD